MKREGKRAGFWRKAAMVAGCAALAAALASVAACSSPAPQKAADPAPAAAAAEEPKAQEQTSAPASATDEEAVLSSMGILANDYQSRDAGPFMDQYNIPAKLNAGSRGCDACHEDLQATVKEIAPVVHIMTTGAIFGKTVDWNDCESCHSMQGTRGGVYLGEFMHNTHYSSPVFTDTNNGTCWSCHAMAKNGEMVMWDEYVYDEQLSGYAGNVEEGLPESSVEFFHRRGYDADNSIGVSILGADEVDVDVRLDQAMTSEDDRYEAVNYNIPEWTDADFDAWQIEIRGVKNPQSFTFADLEKNFQKQTFQVTQECLVNGVNSSLEDSFEASGYLLADIIEYCGGLEDGCTTVKGFADEGEGWDFCVELDDALKNGSFIAVEYYGHEMTAYEGAPAVLVNPGFPGGTWVKYLKAVEFGTNDVTAPVRIVGGDDFYAGKEDPHLYPCNSAWFNPARDGQVFKVGQPINLEGFAWVWNLDGHSTGAVRFSWDYGHTWVTQEVAADADPNNWQRFYATWTPTEPGTYCLKVEAVDAADSWHQKKPASVILTVEE